MKKGNVFLIVFIFIAGLLYGGFENTEWGMSLEQVENSLDLKFTYSSKYRDTEQYVCDSKYTFMEIEGKLKAIFDANGGLVQVYLYIEDWPHAYVVGTLYREYGEPIIGFGGYLMGWIVDESFTVTVYEFTSPPGVSITWDKPIILHGRECLPWKQ